MTMQQRPQNGQNEAVLGMLRRQAEATEGLLERALDTPAEHSVPFAPYLRLGERVRLIKADGAEDVVVDAVGAMPHFRHSFGTLSPASSPLESREVAGIRALNGEFVQYRFSPVAAFEVTFSNPAPVRQWRSRTEGFRLPPWLLDTSLPDTVRQFYEMASQFWVFEDQTPRFDLHAVAGLQVIALADFWGWRYHYQPSRQGGVPKRVIRLSGWPSGTVAAG